MLKLLFAVLLGAGVMYLFDPGRGSERRQALSDKFRAGRESRHELAVAGKDTVVEAKDRAQTVAANARGRFGQGTRETVADVKDQARGIAESTHQRADSVFASDNERS
jgi:hypothetical protein